MRRLSEIAQEQYEFGYNAFLEGRARPDPETCDESYVIGWCAARQDAGLDPAMLNKRANQLKALGFTIPNEEK